MLVPSRVNDLLKLSERYRIGRLFWPILSTIGLSDFHTIVLTLITAYIMQTPHTHRRLSIAVIIALWQLQVFKYSLADKVIGWHYFMVWSIIHVTRHCHIQCTGAASLCVVRWYFLLGRVSLFWEQPSQAGIATFTITGNFNSKKLYPWHCNKNITQTLFLFRWPVLL